MIACVARLVPKKRHHDVVTMFATWRVLSPRSVLWLVGEGDTAYKATLERRIDELGCMTGSSSSARGAILRPSSTRPTSPFWRRTRRVPQLRGEAIALGRRASRQRLANRSSCSSGVSG